MRFSVDAMRRIYLEGAGLTDIWFNFIPMIILIIISMSIIVITKYKKFNNLIISFIQRDF